MSKFNKAIAMMFFSVFAAVFKIPPSWKRPFALLFARLRRGVLWVRRKAVRSLNRSARRLGLPMDLLSEPLDDDGVEAWVYGRVHLRPPSWRDEPKRQLTYVVVMLMWAMAVWVLLTYVTLIRAMQGKEAEELLINTWGLGLLFEQVRVTCTYLPPMASRLRALSLRHERVPVGSPPQGSARNAACAHSRRKIL
jgi:hypothetical protein